MTVTRETLTVNGLSRWFMLSLPASYSAARSYPVVLVMHGDGGDGASMRGALPLDNYSGNDAIVAYPTSKTAGWDLYAPSSSNDDHLFLLAIVESLRARFNVDATRLFATGFSSGGFMANQLACRTTLFRGIASHSGGAPEDPLDPAAATWPNGYAKCANQSTGVAVLIVHGTDDNVVAYPSGEYEADYWSYVNGCAESRAATTPAPCQRQSQCPSDKPVVFCGIAGLGHALWQEAAKTDWAFFSTL
jgi:polyhydroxybutyrate depolymerase